MNLKKIVFALLALVLLASFAAFGFFTLKSYRKASRLSEAEAALANDRIPEAKWLLRSVIRDDPNNERATVLLADLAQKNDNPPEEAWYRYRAMCLNPLDKSKIPPYMAALVRMREFERLREYAGASEDDPSFTLDLDDRAVKVEELITKGIQCLSDDRPADAEAVFAQGTNLNYYAVAPLLAQSLIAQNKVQAAIDLYDVYLQKFPVRSMALYEAELLAVTGSYDRLAKLTDLFPQTSTEAIAFACYIDSLISFNKGDIAATAKAFPAIRSEISSPYSLLISIAVDLHNGEEAQAEQSYRELMKARPFLDFKVRGRQLIRDNIARRLAAGEQPYRLLRLAKLVLESGEDFELQRLVLLGRYQMHTLTENELSAVIARHPEDKALLKLQEWLSADLARIGKAKAEEAARVSSALEEAKRKLEDQTEAAREANRQKEAERIVPQTKDSQE